mmetsp:Transcript_52832/g.85519  ORF Transcript_52832/g.85519 Transcript_52832/m.85519 type:complete len:86 (-) Transcript_52832:119-376(-)
MNGSPIRFALRGCGEKSFCAQTIAIVVYKLSPLLLHLTMQVLRDGILDNLARIQDNLLRLRSCNFALQVEREGLEHFEESNGRNL